MSRVLVPVDGSDNALRAVKHAASIAKHRSEMEIHLLNIQEPVAGRLHAYLTNDEIQTLQSVEIEAALQPAKKIFDDAGIAHVAGVRVGAVDHAIAVYVEETQCEAIIMGTRGMGNIGNLLLGSVAAKVVHLVNVPVTLIK